jgi:CHASE2 domain-containing sensor protein
MLIGVTIIALQGQQVMHYWWTLVLLGIGWNFLFLTGTVLLTECYQPSEKHKLQAVNDFIIFAVQAISSLLAGWIIFTAGWHFLVYVTIPFIVIVTLAWFKFQRLPYH